MQSTSELERGNSMPDITLVHFIYLFFVIGIVAMIVMRKDTVALTLVGLFVVGALTKHSIVGGLQGIYNSVMYSATNVLNIPILIAVIYALAQVMKTTGADYLMVAPTRRLLGRPTISFWVLGVIMFVLALFLWPTAAAGLIGAILVPVAVAAGMPPLTAAVPLAMFGHGGALSGDWVIQGAPTIMSKASGIPVPQLLSTSVIIVGSSLLVGSIVAFAMLRKEMVAGFSQKGNSVDTQASAQAAAALEVPQFAKYAKVTAIVVPIVLLADIIIMAVNKLIGGDATALLGGSVFLLLVFINFMEFGSEALEKTVRQLKDGFMFSFEIFTPVFVIAAFFMIGSPDGAAAVFGKGAPGYMVDLGRWLASVGAVNKPVLAIVQVLLSSITGMDGAGFAQLPFIGSLARTLATGIGANPVPLAVLGQMATIWTAGALIPWGFMAALGAFCNVDPVELARKNFIPTMAAFATGTIICIFMM